MTVKAGRPLLQLVGLAYRADEPIMLVGTHGIGKSELLVEAARSLSIDCRILDLSLCEPIDLVGLPRIADQKTTFAPPAMLPVDGVGLLVLEELNRAPRHVRAPCLQLLTARRLNDYVLPPGWLPVASINGDDAVTPDEESGDEVTYHVDELDPALTSRFVRVAVAPDVAEWLTWAREHDVHQAVLDAVEAGGDEALTRSGGNPRAWTKASRLLRAYDATKDSEQVLLVALIGVLGERWGTIALRTFSTRQKPLAAAEIVARFPHWKPLVETWKRSQRLDLITASWAGLQRHLSSNRVAGSVARDGDRRSNVDAFIGALPADLRRDARSWVDAQLASFAGNGSVARAR